MGAEGAERDAVGALFEELVREHRVTGAQLAVYRDGASASTPPARLGPHR
ncbi:hypothetical protein [Streptomyces sp. CBG33]|nr:hypothetical protein [Streptomyces sp. CBG33]